MNSKRILANNLSSLMNKYGIDRIKLSSDLGIKYTTLTSWITCQKYPRINNINKLARYFHVSRADLVDRSESKLPDGAIKATGPYKKLPVIGQIACGNPIDAIKDPKTYKLTDADELPSGINYWLKCEGDSMFPTITNGSYVLIHQQSMVGENHIAAAQLQDQVDDRPDVTLKRVVKQQKHIILLKPDNSKYDPIIINKDNPGRIIGRAIKVEHDL